MSVWFFGVDVVTDVWLVASVLNESAEALEYIVVAAFLATQYMIWGWLGNLRPAPAKFPPYTRTSRAILERAMAGWPLFARCAFVALLACLAPLLLPAYALYITAIDTKVIVGGGMPTSAGRLFRRSEGFLESGIQTAMQGLLLLIGDLSQVGTIALVSFSASFVSTVRSMRAFCVVWPIEELELDLEALEQYDQSDPATYEARVAFARKRVDHHLHEVNDPGTTCILNCICCCACVGAPKRLHAMRARAEKLKVCTPEVRGPKGPRS